MNNVIMLIYRSRNYDHRVATIISHCLKKKWQVTQREGKARVERARE